MADKDPTIQIAAALGFAGAAIIRNAIQNIRKVRILEDIPNINIASAPQGLVEIEAFAWPENGFRETASGRKAVYYEINLQQLVKRNDKSEWKTVWTNIFDAPFYAIDRTGVLRVKLLDAELNLRAKVRHWNKLKKAEKDLIETQVGFLSGFPPESSFFIFRSSFRIEEKEILLGSPINILGTLESDTSRREIPHTPALKRFREFLGRVGKRSLKSIANLDLDHDGKVSEEEATISANLIAQQAYEAPHDWKGKPPIPTAKFRENIVYGSIKSTPDRRLLLADSHEDFLIDRLGSGTWNSLKIVFGALLIGAAAFVLIHRFHH